MTGNSMEPLSRMVAARAVAKDEKPEPYGRTFTDSCRSAPLPSMLANASCRFVRHNHQPENPGPSEV
jgi:hypothetical protein